MTKIMLVEDDNNLREIYEARLAAEGYEIVSAADGEAALALASKERPDLVISDVMMPKISGFEMLDILRNTENLRDVKVIMLTALGQSEDSTRGKSLGADRYLVKSQVTLEDIVKAAHDLIDGNDAVSPLSSGMEMPNEQPAAETAELAVSPVASPEPEIAQIGMATAPPEEADNSPAPVSPQSTSIPLSEPSVPSDASAPVADATSASSILDPTIDTPQPAVTAAPAPEPPAAAEPPVTTDEPADAVVSDDISVAPQVTSVPESESAAPEAPQAPEIVAPEAPEQSNEITPSAEAAADTPELSAEPAQDDASAPADTEQPAETDQTDGTTPTPAQEAETPVPDFILPSPIEPGSEQPAASPVVDTPAPDPDPDPETPQESATPAESTVAPAETPEQQQVEEALPQGIAEEEAAIQAQIDSFIQNQDAETTPPQPETSDLPEPAIEQPSPSADTAPVVAEQAPVIPPTPSINIPVTEPAPETPEVQAAPDTSAQPSVTPEPANTVPAPADTQPSQPAAPQDTNLVSNAMDELMADSKIPPAPEEAANPNLIQPTPQAEAAPAPQQTDQPLQQEQPVPTSQITGKKVIAPINNGPRTAIHQLLELEEARAAARQAAQTQPAVIPQNNGQQPNNTPQQQSGQPFDPNSISL